MTDDAVPGDGADPVARHHVDISAADEQGLTDLFAALVADAPPSEVSPLEVLELGRTERRHALDGRIKRLKVVRNVLVAAVFAALVVLIVPHLASSSSSTAASVSSSSAASAADRAPVAAAAAGSAAAGSAAAGSASAGSASAGSAAASSASAGSAAAVSAAPAAAPASLAGASAAASAPASAAMTSAAAVPDAAVPDTTATVMNGSSTKGADGGDGTSAAASSASGSAMTSGAMTSGSAANVTGTTSSTCPTLPARSVAAFRSAFPAGYFGPPRPATTAGPCDLFQTSLTIAKAGVTVTVAIRKAADGACRPACRAESGQPGVYFSTIAIPVPVLGPVFIYADGYEVVVQAIGGSGADQNHEPSLDRLVAGARAVIKTLG